MNSSTGWARTSAWRPLRKAGEATRWSRGSLRVASTRSLSAPERGRQQPERARERGVLVPDRVGGGVRVADERGQVVAPLGDRAGGAGGVHQEARERALVLGHLLDEPAG